MGAFDLVVIGGGIIGLATALQMLRRFPHLKVVLLEKEGQLAQHQSGHNSGVIHTGVYYRPGSLKANYCLSGADELIEFCLENEIAVHKVGKVIVATEEEEIPRLRSLEERGRLNGVPDLERIDSVRLKEIEPNAAGIEALHSPHTSIVDFAQVAEQFGRLFEQLGGEVHLNEEVLAIRESAEECLVRTSQNEYTVKYLINCAGIYADRVAHLADPAIAANQIFPFRGEYYMVRKHKADLVRGLIYPVPDPKFPFLGVHLTKTIHGDLEAGPNAVLAFSREGYHMWNINLRDCFAIASSAGFWKMAGKFWKTGGYEFYRSLSKKAFHKAVQRLLPCLAPEDIVPAGSGIRAQVIGSDGNIVDDFVIEKSRRMLHVLSAPSPGATASLAIGRHLVNEAAQVFSLES